MRLSELLDNYDDYRGRTETRTSSHNGWSSDGMYTRTITVTDTFTDGVDIRTGFSYQDDGRQSGVSSTETKDARGILNWLRDHR